MVQGSGSSDRDDSGFDTRHDPELVERIMRMIEDYNREKKIIPTPAALRDTMLAVAALLHLSAAGVSDPEKPFADSEGVREAFCEAAQEQIQAVVDAGGAKLTGQRQ